MTIKSHKTRPRDQGRGRGPKLPYDWLADNTRWQRKPRTFSSVEQALRDTAAFYRKSLFLEIWLPRRVGLHHSPWPAGAAFDATAR